MGISDQRFLKELQAEFKALFPFLEILFYRSGSLDPIDFLFEPNLRVGDLRVGGSDGLLVLDGNRAAAAIEQTLLDIFGLHILIGYCKRMRGRYLPLNKPLNELNFRAMHLTEDVVII